MSSSTATNSRKPPEIADKVFDSDNCVIYRTGKFYGKGGFAKCYELINERGEIFAGKIVPKKILEKSNHREKMTQEIAIHKRLKHTNVVNYFGFFEDSQNIYILLELCRKRSMMELHKRRVTLTEPETRYYMHQILDGVHYLHRNQIIHRDLKLGNLFLTDDLVVKIGDFGLAAQIKFDGERKKTLCGTPNYIAPEILMKNGHSFEVDIWSIGCIMYTLLMGTPPFETKTLKETYTKIKNCEYVKPSQATVTKDAIQMIDAMLQHDPKKRPNIKTLMDFSFIRNGYMPTSLPASSLTTAPRFDQVEYFRRPLTEMNKVPLITTVTATTAATGAATAATSSAATAAIGVGTAAGIARNADLCTSVQVNTKHEVDDLLQNLIGQLMDLLYKKKLQQNEDLGVESSDPEAHPIVWISKWVDYTDKYGFGYQLSDDCVGVLFNDNTKLILLANGINVHYIEGETETYMTTTNHSTQHHKKMRLLTFFVKYMQDNLMKTGANMNTAESDHLARTPYVNYWCRTSCAVIFHLTNGLVQVNFSDHNKIIICPRMRAITLLSPEQAFTTYRFATLEKHGCSKMLAKYMYYALEKIKTFVEL